MENDFKVALVNPRMFIKSYHFFPIALGLLASALEKDSIPYTFYDLHIDWLSDSQFLKQVERDGAPDLFALTGLLTSFQSVQKLCRAIKKRFPDAKIVIGGRISVMTPEFMFKHIETDYIIQGEGELGLVQLVAALGGGDLSRVSGLAYRDKNGFIDNGEADPIETISAYPIPYHRFDMATYVRLCNIQSPKVPSLNMLSSRGCPYSCTFCNNSKGKKKVRLYSVDYFVNDLDYLISNFGLEHVTFNDDIFTLNKPHMEGICAALKKRNISFSMSTRLDFLNEESIKLLDESGCHYLCVGIESPSPTVAKVIDKRLDLEKYQCNIDALKKSNIIVNYGFIFGYLGETEQTIAETRDFVIKNQIIYSAFFANAFPKTKLYDLIQHKIPDEEEYLRRLFTVDLSKDYLLNLTNIESIRLFKLRDELIVDSVIGAIGPKKIWFPLPLLRVLATAYLRFMRRFGLKTAFFKTIFEFVNMIIVKPMAKR